MITGFSKETSELSEKEKELVPLFVAGLQRRIGKDNAITNVEIRNIMLQKFNVKVPGTRVRKIINHIRITEKVPCLCATSNRYYVAKDEFEMKEYLTSLSERVDAQVHLLNQLRIQHGRKYPNASN
jgi:hypothetical protein